LEAVRRQFWSDASRWRHPGGRPGFDFDSYLAALNEAFNRLKLDRARLGKRPTLYECAEAVEPNVLAETVKSRFRGKSWKQLTRDW